LRNKPPKTLPKSFSRDMAQMRAETRSLATRFKKLWVARNKNSRLADIIAEFDRLEGEYKRFA
jgi:hypothetical protein